MILNYLLKIKGKTSLLNALNFHTKGKIRVEGKIMINGCEVDATRMAMVSSKLYSY